MVSVTMSKESELAKNIGKAQRAAGRDIVDEAFPVDDGDEFETHAVGRKPGTCVEFENRFFKCFDEPYFRLTDLRGGQPVLVCKIGADEMLLPLKGIMLEYNIAADSPDGQMLMAIAEALNYVKVIRPGDALPPELFSDGVSWHIDRHHHAIAHRKLSGQLLEWIFEGDSDVSAAELLDRIATDENAKAKLNEAFGETAKKLGLGEGGREQVAGMIEELADDLAYIEALREKYLAMEQIQRTLLLVQQKYKSERTMFNLVRSVAPLHFKAVKEFRKIFGEVDAQTGEIIAVLKNLGAQKRYIRKARNKLHTRLMPWDDIIEAWDSVPVRRSETISVLLRQLYRFLAPRYMPVDEWVIQSSPSKRSGDDDERWDADEDEAPYVHVMNWD